MRFIKVILLISLLVFFIQNPLFGRYEVYAGGGYTRHHANLLYLGTKLLKTDFVHFSGGVSYKNSAGNVSHNLHFQYFAGNEFELGNEQLPKGRERIIMLPVFYSLRSTTPIGSSGINFIYGVGLFFNYCEYGYAAEDYVIKNPYISFNIGPKYGISFSLFHRKVSFSFLHSLYFGFYDSRFGFSAAPIHYSSHLHFFTTIPLSKNIFLKAGFRTLYLINAEFLTTENYLTYDQYINPVMQNSDSFYIETGWRFD